MHTNGRPHQPVQAVPRYILLVWDPRSDHKQPSPASWARGRSHIFDQTKGPTPYHPNLLQIELVSHESETQPEARCPKEGFQTCDCKAIPLWLGNVPW